MKQHNHNIEYSVVAPFFNEEKTVRPLYDALRQVMGLLGSPYELVFVNDGSTDKTLSVLQEISKQDERLVVINSKLRRGQTISLKTAFDKARGNIIISMDGDMQNDPNDIPELISELKKGYDFVCGWRYKRKDPLSKKIASRFANLVQNNVFRSHLHDISCTLRAYKRDAIRELSLRRKGAHRFIPYLLMMKGKAGSEIKVNHLPRPYGKTKYGFTRSFKVSYDFLSLLFNSKSWL